MGTLIGLIIAAGIIGYLLLLWYRQEEIYEAEATVHLQSEHEHFHFHVDLPSTMKIQPGDTLHILSLPDDLDKDGRTEGELTYTSPIRLHKASWLQRHLIKSSSLVEVTELIED